MKISPNVVSDSNDENEFPQKLLWTNTHDLRPRKTFANNFSTNIKLSETQLHQLVLSGGILARVFEPLPKIEFLLMKNVLKPLAKSVLIPLRLTAAASTTDAAIHKKMMDQVHVFCSSFFLIYQYKMTQYNTLNLKLFNS